MITITYSVRSERRALTVIGALTVLHVGTKQAAFAWQQELEQLELMGYRFEEIESAAAEAHPATPPAEQEPK